MTTVLNDTALRHAAPPTDPHPATATVVLLGLGRVGSAVADVLARERPAALAGVRIAGALVRRDRETAPGSFPVSTDGAALLDRSPDVVVETLGGVEPARTLVLEALRRSIPVVTANKTLLAVHGDELFDAASRFNAPLRYEASVIAGVPFLGTFAGRPLAAQIDGITGILNGTSNYLLSRLEDGCAARDALSDAQRHGYAEPDASKDLDGSDAAEKLAILIRSFARLSVAPGCIRATSIERVGPDDLTRARELGGRLKPVAHARWDGSDVSCFVGPAFLASDDPLAGLGGVLNGIRLERTRAASLYFSGPGAGPDVTARTILDDVAEVLRDRGAQEVGETRRARVLGPTAPGWFVTFKGASLPNAADAADLLSAHGIWVRRWGATRMESDGTAQSALTFPCDLQQLEGALHALSAASGCSTGAWPIVEAAHA